MDESLRPDEGPESYVTRLSQAKAAAVLGRIEAASVVLAADTTVEFAGNILGKPGSKQECRTMLGQLSGSQHRVLTGVTVASVNIQKTLCTQSLVRFRHLSAAEIDYYWDTGEPADKAGGYGLQGVGAAFVESLSGSYTSVIGLPLSETIMLLRECGIECMGDSRSPEQNLFVVEGSQHD